MAANETETKSPGHMVFQWHITDNRGQRCKHCYIFGSMFLKLNGGAVNASNNTKNQTPQTKNVPKTFLTAAVILAGNILLCKPPHG